MAVIDTGYDIDDFISNVVKTIKDWDTTFGNIFDNRIYRVVTAVDSLNAVSVSKPSIYVIFTSKVGDITGSNAAHTGRHYVFTGEYTCKILMLWSGGDKEASIVEARQRASSLSCYLDEHNANGFGDVVVLVNSVSPYIPETDTAETGLVGYEIDYICRRTVERNLQYG